MSQTAINQFEDLIDNMSHYRVRNQQEKMKFLADIYYGVMAILKKQTLQDNLDEYKINRLDPSFKKRKYQLLAYFHQEIRKNGFLNNI